MTAEEETIILTDLAEFVSERVGLFSCRYRAAAMECKYVNRSSTFRFEISKNWIKEVWRSYDNVALIQDPKYRENVVAYIEAKIIRMDRRWKNTNTK